MDKNIIKWKENFCNLGSNLVQLPKFLLQCSLYPVNIRETTSRKEKILKTFDNQEVFVSTRGISQFNLFIWIAFRKLVAKNRNFSYLQVTISDLIHALRRYDGGRTRQTILETLRREQNIYVAHDFNDGSHVIGCPLQKVRELKQNELLIILNEDYLSGLFTHDDEFIY